MNTYHPYKDDRDLWHMMPVEDRWIMNKLNVAVVQGIDAAPVGVRIIKPGAYCIRPIMNTAGRGTGGVTKFNAINTQQGVTQPDYTPGWFWTPWLDGHHAWTEYINNTPVRQTGGYEVNGYLRSKEENPDIQLPEVFHNISRYMMAENIDGVIIEVSPRHMATIPSQITIDDYKTINPDYTGLKLNNVLDLRKIGNDTEFYWDPVKVDK